MIYTIQNEFLTVQAEDLGAQLASIRTPDGEEYLWQGDPDIWARRAPILFPFIARLREGQYDLDGQTYSISTHGFARDSLFSVVDQGPDRISFQLTDTPETRAVYPFAFSLTVTYTLEGNRLKKSHRVENRSDKDMYYELGAHDGFRAPVEPGVPMSSWSIRLPGVERVQFYGMDESCTLTPKGEREAELLADKMEGEQLTHIYISPLGRAQRTAAATLKRLRREGTTLDWLREFTYPIRLPDTGEEHLIWDFKPAFMRRYPQLYSAEGWQTPEFIRKVYEVDAQVMTGEDGAIHILYHAQGKERTIH